MGTGAGAGDGDWAGNGAGFGAHPVTNKTAMSKSKPISQDVLLISPPPYFTSLFQFLDFGSIGDNQTALRYQNLS